MTAATHDTNTPLPGDVAIALSFYSVRWLHFRPHPLSPVPPPLVNELGAAASASANSAVTAQSLSIPVVCRIISWGFASLQGRGVGVGFEELRISSIRVLVRCTVVPPDLLCVFSYIWLVRVG